MAASEKVLSDKCAQWRFRSACAFMQSDQNPLWGTFWMAKDAKFLHVDNKDLNLTVQTHTQLKSSCASAQSNQNLCCQHEEICILGYQKCAQWGFWSDCTYALLGVHVRRYIFSPYDSYGLWFGIHITVFTLSIGTPYLHTILVIKFETVHSTSSWCVESSAGCIVNIVDPDQMPHSAASDLGLHCLHSNR